MASFGEKFSSSSNSSLTTLFLPVLSSRINTSAPTSTTSIPFLHVQKKPIIEQITRETTITDGSSEQTCHSDPIFKVSKEKNAIFERTNRMIFQKQEQHDKQLKIMQEHHRNQMKIMQEQHNEWLKLQGENLYSMLQIQQSQAELQVSIHQLWQNISNNKEQ